MSRNVSGKGGSRKGGFGRSGTGPGGTRPGGTGPGGTGAGRGGSGSAANPSRGGGRLKTVRVRTAKGRKASSQRWLARQLNDPYVAEAHRLGLRSRAAFKIIQLDDRFGIFRRGARVVDLGAAPGGWTQVAVERVGTLENTGLVVGLDMLEMEPVAGAEILLANIHETESVERLRHLLNGSADVVLSDMAAPTTGHASTDHLRTVALCELALDFALLVLAPGGTFVAKVFKGGAEGGLLGELKRNFTSVRHAKPEASRAESAETYVVAMGYKGHLPDPEAD